MLTRQLVEERVDRFTELKQKYQGSEDKIDQGSFEAWTRARVGLIHILDRGVPDDKLKEEIELEIERMNVHLVSTAAYGKEFGEQYPDIFQHSFGKYQALKTIIVHLKRLAKGEK